MLMRQTIDKNFSRIVALAMLAIMWALAADARAVTMSWSYVGNAGNAVDSADGDSNTPGIQHFGAVGYNYNIGTYDATNSQYVAFLNLNLPGGETADPLALYNAKMNNATYGGIGYNPSAPSGSKYTVGPSNAQNPVNYVSWYDAIRFANWMNNGQVPGSTETGAYTLLGGTPTPTNGNSITRNPGATVFLPSENEWYKAAYYNPGNSSYYQFPTSSNTAPIGTDPTSLANHANIGGGHGPLTNVGAYTGTTSRYGAYDMGGDVSQWNESLIGSSRGAGR